MSEKGDPLDIIQNSRPTDSILNTFSKEQFIASIKTLSEKILNISVRRF